MKIYIPQHKDAGVIVGAYPRTDSNYQGVVLELKGHTSAIGACGVTVEMTAQELIDKKPETRTFGLLAWSDMAVEMLRQQAEQLSVWLAANSPGGWIDDLRRENAALKADAERIRECAARLVDHADFNLGGILSADSKSKDIPSKATSQVKARHLAALRDALKAIDAMKGAT